MTQPDVRAFLLSMLFSWILGWFMDIRTRPWFIWPVALNSLGVWLLLINRYNAAITALLVGGLFYIIACLNSRTNQ